MYHVECQSTSDTTMAVRMVEYDFAIALEQALASGEPYEMDFPSSCVLFLRHDDSTPDVLTIRVNLPDGESFDYHAKIMKAQRYDSDELFAKHLLLLLPFYLMRYERLLAAIAADDDRTARLLEECAELRDRLERETVGSGDQLLYEQLTELIIRVSDHVMRAYEALQQKVRAVMGGEVLELLNDKAERLQREAEDRGMRKGREEGIAELLKLRDLGVDESLVAAAVAALEAGGSEGEGSDE